MKLKKLFFNHPENIYITYLIAIFFLAQFLYFLAHAGFHSAFFGLDFMMVDIPAITAAKGHLLQSIFYYNLSPPLYALYSAAFYILFPPQGELGFYVLHTILGIYAVYCLYKLQRKLDINPILATFLTTVFILSPGFNLTESIAFYDFPVACLLIISAWRFAKVIENPCFSTGLVFFSVVALVCSIRSLYHVFLYMTPVILITVIVLKKNWKIILLSSLIPFLFVFSAYLKNYVLFNVFTTSSYFGETLDSIVMQFNVNLQQREEGIKKGFFSDLALCPSVGEGSKGTTPTSKLTGWYCYSTFANKYRDAYVNQLGKNYQNIPLLSCEPDKTIFPGVFFPRRSCLGNIGMSKEYEKNAIQAIIHYPQSYFRGIEAAWRQYFATNASNFYEVMGNSRHLPLELSSSWIRYPAMQLPDPKLAFSIPLLILFPFLIFFSVCYILFSKKVTSLFLVLYVLAFFGTTYEVSARIAIYQLWPIFQNWDLEESLIMSLLGMLVGMIFITLIFRTGLFLIKKITNYSNKIFYPSINFDKRIIVLYLLGNIIFTSLIITLLVGFAQQRYRFYIDGFYLVLFGLFTQTIILPIVTKLFALGKQCMPFKISQKQLSN